MKINRSDGELIRDIKDKILFLVTIEIFFSTLIYGFFKAQGKTEIISNDNASVWGIGVALCIANYILIEHVSGSKTLQFIRGFIYANFICFIPLLIFTTLVQHQPQPESYAFPFTVGLLGSLWLPIATCPIIVGIAIAQWIKK